MSWEWVKVAHLLFVMAWMAGVFYLPRILVHYVEGKQAGEDVSRLVIMARKLLRFSTVMAVLAIIPGLVLWMYYGIYGQWLWAKLVFVVALIGYQHMSFRYVRKMEADEIIETSLFFRLYNESALLLVIPILIFVTVKPF